MNYQRPPFNRRSQRPQMDNIDGALLIDKGMNMTSHDVVAIARRSLNQKKIGHCGTLDPMATGLLILLLGKGTKIQDLLMAEDKEYEGTLTLGVTTSSQDKEGDVLEEKPVPSFVDADIRDAFDAFRGDFYQMPPMVSAIKKDGVPLYKLARQGKVVEREPRFVHVFNYALRRIELPEVEFIVRCSKGFYVRTYAHDIGAKLECGAHLSQLRRTRSGKFDVGHEKIVTIDELKNLSREQLAEKTLSLPEISLLRGA